MNKSLKKTIIRICCAMHLKTSLGRKLTKHVYHCSTQTVLHYYYLEIYKVVKIIIFTDIM